MQQANDNSVLFFAAGVVAVLPLCFWWWIVPTLLDKRRWAGQYGSSTIRFMGWCLCAGGTIILGLAIAALSVAAMHPPH